MKYTFNIVKCRNSCEPIWFKLRRMQNTTKLYSWILVWMTLIFTQGHRVSGKVELVQLLCCKVTWSNSSIRDVWLCKKDDCEWRIWTVWALVLLVCLFVLLLLSSSFCLGHFVCLLFAWLVGFLIRCFCFPLFEHDFYPLKSWITVIVIPAVSVSWTPVESPLGTSGGQWRPQHPSPRGWRCRARDGTPSSSTPPPPLPPARWRRPRWRPGEPRQRFARPSLAPPPPLSHPPRTLAVCTGLPAADCSPPPLPPPPALFPSSLLPDPPPAVWSPSAWPPLWLLRLR